MKKTNENLAKYGLEITDTHVFIVDRKGNDRSGILAIAEIELNGILMVGSLRLFKSVDGLFYFNFPKNPQSKRGRSYSFVKDDKARAEILEAIVLAYKKELEHKDESPEN